MSNKTKLFIIVFVDEVQKRIKGPYNDLKVAKIVLLNTSKKYVRIHNVSPKSEITLCITDTYCETVFVESHTTETLEDLRII